MGPDLAVIHFPLLNDLFSVFDGNEQVGVQNIFAEGSVKTFHHGILLRFPFLNVTPHNLSIVEPFFPFTSASDMKSIAHSSLAAWHSGSEFLGWSFMRRLCRLINANPSRW